MDETRAEITRDDIRAAVAAGRISEAQAASIMTLADTRRGARAAVAGLDEPFELFKGFNEVFIVVGLSILYGGWLGLTGLSTMFNANGYVLTMVFALISLGVTIALARYFTLTRRMVAPSIALALFFGQAGAQLGMGLGWMLLSETPAILTLSAALGTVLLGFYYAWFRVPFTMALIAIGVFVTCFGVVTIGGTLPDEIADIFLLTAEGPFALLTIILGLLGLVVALWFDMGDPHRVSLRSRAGFWLHVIAAPAVVNTVALSLFDLGTATAQLLVVVFVTAMAVFAVAIDRRSFLVSGVGYIVALAITVIEDQAYVVIILLGAVLVLLGAQWEKLRNWLMQRLPNFPGKDRLPPW